MKNESSRRKCGSWGKKLDIHCMIWGGILILWMSFIRQHRFRIRYYRESYGGHMWTGWVKSAQVYPNRGNIEGETETGVGGYFGLFIFQSINTADEVTEPILLQRNDDYDELPKARWLEKAGVLDDSAVNVSPANVFEVVDDIMAFYFPKVIFNAAVLAEILNQSHTYQLVVAFIVH